MSSGGETVRPINLTIWDQLHIHFTSTTEAHGHIGEIGLLVLDETNYLKREAGEPYDKLFSAYTAKYNQYCLVTHNGTWYFVWHNTFKSSRDSQLSPVEVYTEIIRNWNETAYRDMTVYHTVVPSAYSTPVEYLGTALIAASGVIIFWGIASKEKETKQTTKL